MPPPYENPQWAVFSEIPHRAAGPVGYIPTVWVARYGLQEVPPGANPLPAHQLDRTAVRAICRNPANPVLFGYVCAMAWGLQGAAPGGAGHVAISWAARASLIPKLISLRTGGLTRCEAYNLFTDNLAVPGLGPAYFTKLLYFFLPVADCYIMDQHTGKSVNFLTGKWVVRMNGNSVSKFNRCGNYQAYCEEVDAIAGILGVTGEQAEEMMMSRGGRHPWAWRAHVRGNWMALCLAGRYSNRAMHASYPQIPLNCF